MRYYRDRIAPDAFYAVAGMVVLFLYIALSIFTHANDHEAANINNSASCTINVGCEQHHNDVVISNASVQYFTLNSCKEGGRFFAGLVRTTPTYSRVLNASILTTDHIYSPTNTGKLVIQYRKLRI